MEEVIRIVLGSCAFCLFVLFLVVFIKWIIKSAANTPSWTGIIISAILGCLPFYLVLCFFGIMGEERDNSDE